MLRIRREKLGKKRCPKTPSNKTTRGRPKTLSAGQECQLLRCLVALCNEEGNFSAKQLSEKAGLSITDVSVHTVHDKVFKQRRLIISTYKRGKRDFYERMTLRRDYSLCKTLQEKLHI